MLNREIWEKEEFAVGNIPFWECTYCKRGHYNLVKENFHFDETGRSLDYRNGKDWVQEDVEYSFHGTLTCNSCLVSVMFLGKGRVADLADPDAKVFSHDYVNLFTPLYFNPPLHIFKLNENLSWDLEKAILDSFRLFWSDFSACANKIRICVEILMTNHRVNKTKMVNGKRKPLSLHQRIQIFSQTKPEIAEILLSIKWIGNNGSHDQEILKDEILDAFALLEYALMKLFDKKEEELLKISREINKRKR